MERKKMNICIIMMADDDYNRIHGEFTKVFEKLQDVTIFYIHHSESNILRRIKSHNTDAIILSGSEKNILSKSGPTLPIGILKLGLPILALCYGYEWIVKKLGGKVATFEDGNKHSYSKYLQLTKPFSVPKKRYAFCHHQYISALPSSGQWEELHRNGDEIWIAQNSAHKWLCLQFHPEVYPSSAIAFYSRWITWLKEK